VNTDAIIVLAGGTRGLLPCLWTKQRMDVAIELFSGKENIILVSGGTSHKLPYIYNGRPIYESEIMCRYLIEKGIPASRILRNSVSFDTVGNAFYSRVIHTDPAELYNLKIVTSEFHLKRSIAIFSHIFSLKPNRCYSLDFIASDDHEIDSKTISERLNREKTSFENLSFLHIETIKDMHKWVYSKHEVYASNLNIKKAKGYVLNSY
jgi:vancomycin permeability regulator SanA